MKTKRLHLLIVDDEEGHIEAIRRAFEAAGSKVDLHAVSTLREYRECVAAEPPDIALVDLNLPDGRGVELLSHPPQNAPFPVLLMTAYGSQQIVLEVMKAGALDYLVKSPEAFASIPHNVESALREWALLQHQKQAEIYREILQILNEPLDLKDAVKRVVTTLKVMGGFDAVGMRLKKGEDFPYFFQEGFTEDFLLTENTLVERGPDGGLCRDKDGKVCLECTCGLVISGKPAPELTKGGSFWTNDSLPLLDLPADQDPRLHPRNNCIHKNYASVALVPIRGKAGIAGLLQLNSHKKDRFTAEIIEKLEYLAASIGEALMRKRAEEDLSQSEARLAEAQTIAKTGSWETRLSDLSVQWSAEIFRIFEIDSADFRPTHPAFLSFIHPEDRAKVDAAFVASIESGSQRNTIEHRIVTAAGREKYVEERWQIVSDDEGRPVRAVGVCQDITDRKLTAEALRGSEAELRTMAEAMPQIVWVTRPDGWNIYFNQKWLDYTGLTLEESLGHGWNKPFHPDDRKLAWNAWQKATTEAGTYSIESRLRRADGVYRWWLVRAVPHLDAAGKILKWYGTCTDIHELKMAEKEREEMQSQLLQSQKMEAVGVLAGGVAHDFNNILTAIKAYAGFIYKNLLPEDPMRSDAEEILTASDRAAALTRQLLAFSRKQILTPQIVDFNKILGEMIKMLTRLLREDIELITKLTSIPCVVLVDPGQAEQVIMNLVVNARDAMPKGGRLILETDVVDGAELVAANPDFPRGPVMRLRVRDNGGGMSDEVKLRIFEPFYTTKTQGKGTGLGLSTVFGIIKQSNGAVSVESEVGKGATFSVFLPLLKEAVPAIAISEPKAAAGKITETVLLVEDDEMLRRLGERLLKESGYNVMAASDGKTALETMERYGKPVDLLLSDVVMPGMSGRDLARELERRKLIRRTLYMSGYIDDAMVTHGVLEPGIALIKKPFAAEALAAKLREVLDGPADQAKA